MAITREAAAQAYPSRPITVVVPFAAGSPSDTLVRILGENMRGTLSQPIVVENVTGASGSIAAGRVACAEADGHTLILGSWVTHVVNGAVYQLKYNVVDDFAPIAAIGTNPLLIVAKKAMPANDLKGLIAWLKANQDKATQGTTGAGTALNIAGVFFKRETGTNHPFVTYRGGSLAMKDLVAGQFDLRIDVAANSLPQVAAGTIKAYAVTAKQRSAAAPTIPTVDEAGLPGLHVSIRFALWAPKATPKDAIGKLNAACGRRSGRRERAEAACQSGLRAPVARAADAGSARRPPESRDRALVAHHQGRRHQGGVGR
ncbi:MAG: tripartite tricarboxylate transporter substrate-binding protein [Hyphomicrobiaceae bacterium]